jgi:cell division protein FtsI/penicillin-binding protein 2
MSAEVQRNSDNRRLTILACFLTFGFTVIVGRLVYYQVIKHEEVYQEAVNLRTREKGLPTRRGYIADVNGNVLALDVVQWDIELSPTLVTDRATVATGLSELLGLSSVELSATLKTTVEWVSLAKGVDFQTGEAIAAMHARGVTCIPRPQRYYPEGALVAHILGFVNNTEDGFYGVEGYHNQQLKGSSGVRQVEQDAAGAELPLPSLAETPPQEGTNLILTLDRNIQYIADDELRKAVKEYGAKSGTVVIMDPKTGAILAAASYPTYDPNDFAHADPEAIADPLVSKLWEPGSIFKIITWAGGLDSGTITPGTTFYDDGRLEVGGRVIQNWDRRGRGLVTMTDGLTQSLNTVAAFISTSMGKDTFYTYLRRFGFGTLSHVDLASEGPGMLKLPGDSNWFPSELGTNAFGQGIAVTPMQMIAAVSAVANHGILMKPHIVHQFIIPDPEGQGAQTVDVDPMVVRSAISPETADTLVNMLVEVVQKEAAKAQVPGYRIAGKTGTAQVPTPYGYHPTETIASFVGFAPADDPKFIALIKLDKPTASPWANHTAAPTFGAIAERLFVYMQIPPDEIRLAQQQEAQ